MYNGAQTSSEWPFPHSLTHSHLGVSMAEKLQGLNNNYNKVRH